MRPLNYRRVVLGTLLASVVLMVGQVALIGLLGSRLLAARAAAQLPTVTPRPGLALLEVLLLGAVLV